ncbi:hypothetical protein M0804_012419 [Polistes exclamans]|nr:hypothetical protein M0804_012419 [Polistes exclamans]
MLSIENSLAISGLESKEFNNDDDQINNGEIYYKYEDEDFNELNDKLTVIPITSNILLKIQRELGLIRLCWPEKDIRENVYLSTLPNSYCNLNDKEKLLLFYAENFRRQFHFKYKKRKPILLACENECGVQKFVSVNIKRSTLPYPELNNWQGCAKFTSDSIIYEPHNDNDFLLLPLLIAATFLLGSSNGGGGGGEEGSGGGEGGSGGGGGGGEGPADRPSCFIHKKVLYYSL